MASQIDIFDKLVLNLDQEEFRKTAVEAVRNLTSIRKIDGKNRRVYSDFSVTITSSMDRRNFDIYRNRTSVLVLSVRNDNVVSISYEYIYVNDHINDLLKEKDGEGTRN